MTRAAMFLLGLAASQWQSLLPLDGTIDRAEAWLDTRMTRLLEAVFGR